MKRLAIYGCLMIAFSCCLSELAVASITAGDRSVTAGDRIAYCCYKLYLGANQECPRSCCCVACGSQSHAPNVRTVARFTLQRPIEPIMWYAGVPYHYGHTDRYHYCRYCHDVNYYYSCHCCVLIIEKIHARN